MTISLARLIAATCVYLLMLSIAHAEGGFLTFEIGQGDIDFDEPDMLPFTPVGNTDDNAVAVSFGGGYVFPSGVYLDLAYTNLDSITLFGLAEIFEYSTTKLGVGYRHQTNERFALLAKTGIALWNLDVREGFFLNPGPETGTGFDGTDVFFEVGVEIIFGERFGMTLTHSRDTYDLGHASASKIGVRYFFGN